ncbi:unnamed protein product [Polarella glacialis]|uniref:Protochlorophyllide reductase n=1 Tax=Polarella glacialis TaxID=89957 RepID=A0A813EBE7_POLGL|nr:unnamed protein product [Polarella glacialis]
MVRGPSFKPTPGSLAGRVCLITGCNSGIGYETAKALAEAGATVLFACRSEQRARIAMAKLLEESKAAGVLEKQLHFLPLDLSSLSSVRRCAKLLEESNLEVQTLVLNAGVMLRSRALSEDKFEMTMASNHLGHFLLVQLLLPHMLASESRGGQPRIVVVGSNLCYKLDVFDFSEVVAVKDEREKRDFMAKPYELFRAYSQSKLANLLFTKELASRLWRQGSRIPVNCVHPGEVLTEISRDFHPAIVWLYGVFRPVCFALFKSQQQGAVCSTFLGSVKGVFLYFVVVVVVVVVGFVVCLFLFFMLHPKQLEGSWPLLRTWRPPTRRLESTSFAASPPS